MPVAAFNIDSQLTNNPKGSTNKRISRSPSPLNHLPTDNSTIQRQMSPSNVYPEEEDNRLAPRAFIENKPMVGTYKRQRHGEPEYSFGNERRVMREPNAPLVNNNPGAGQYDQEVRVRPHNGALISKVGRQQQQFNQNPGPGQHDPDVSPLKSRSPTYVMGKEQKNTYMGKFNQNPGPGNYEHSTSIGKGKAVPFPTEARQDNFKNRQSNPGPGLYSPMSRQKQEANGHTFGQTKKGLRHPDNKSPGAGSYECTTNMANPNKSSTFGREQRVLYKINNQVPGPGHYEHEDYGHRTVRN